MESFSISADLLLWQNQHWCVCSNIISHMMLPNLRTDHTHVSPRGRSTVPDGNTKPCLAHVKDIIPDTAFPLYWFVRALKLEHVEV